MEADLDKQTVSRPSFLSAVELSPRTGPVDATDVKKNLYGDFSSTFNTSQRESLESKEQIHVCLRVKPILELEKEHDAEGCVSVVDSTSIILKAPKGSKTFRLSEKNLRQLVQKFTFSQVFGPKTTQEELFDGALKQPMLDFLKGHSRLIFTYGVTNAGKTHTYQGTDEDRGILPRTLDMVFQSIGNKLYPDTNLKPHRCREYKNLSKEEAREEISQKNSLLRLLKEVDCHSNTNRTTTDNCEDKKEPEKEADQFVLEEQRDVNYSLWVSFCEIYNECIYDLLLPISNDKRRKMLRLAQDIKGYSYVKDLRWVQVSNSKEAYKLMKVGLRHQSYASTKLNANSSRSHSIFTVKMLKIDSETTRVMQVNELFLCDLAGSERCTRTCNEGERLKESGNINTSLLILGKCIGALKSNQQTKLQQHIPFRESKLTHFFQGFFSGKGKVCMIVNVSQSPSAYDETLNVLKFSAIAQKVMVLDPESPLLERVDHLSFKAASESILDDGVCLPTKRATIFWEGTLEDVMEDEEELVEEGTEEHLGDCLVEDTHAKEADPRDEMESQLEDEDSDIIIKKEQYQKLLDIIEELRNKLIEEKKAKLYNELKIREEVTQECFKYFSAKESDLKKIYTYKEEIMATTCEERMNIYKDLVKDCTAPPDGKGGAEETLKEDEKAGGENGAPGSAAHFPSMVESLQHNVADIKQQAEMAFGMLDALEEPQVTIERLQQQLADITAKLAQTQEDFFSRNKVAVMQEEKLSESTKVLQDATEKMALQNKHIQDLSQAVQQKAREISQLQTLVGHLEATIKDSEVTIANIKQQMEQENCSESKEESAGSRRKRYLERDDEGPPSKQGFIHHSSDDAVISEKADETQSHPLKGKGDTAALEEQIKMLEVQEASLREKLEKEENEKEGFSREIARLSEALSLEKERASGLNKELQQQQKIQEQATLEIAVLKERNKSQEEKIQILLQEIGAASQITVEEKSQVKTLEAELGLRLSSHCPVVDVDLAKQETMPRDEPLPTRANADQKSSFHCSVEGIWKISQQIIKDSSQKSSCIADLMQQVEQLQRKTSEADEENSQLTLKLSATISQRDAFVQEKASLLNQLRGLEQTNAFYAEKYKEEENRAVERIKTNKDLLEECRAKDVRMAFLEQTVKDKDSAVLVMKPSVQDMEEKLGISEAKILKFVDQESQLKMEVRDLKRLNEVEREKREELKQVTKELKEELSKSTDLSSRLQAEIQQKDEEYADLKEKLADTKKQIEQVQRQVSSMRAEEKLLRNKVNELEKAKGQLTEELDLKQRTIQQFKKDDLSKKLEDLLQQYQKSCEDVRCKEKIIDNMRLTLEEQEQTQSEQDQILQATLAENERCTAELKKWERKHQELKEQKNDLRPQDIHEGCEKDAKLLHEQLKQLQGKSEECKEQHETDRRKWLAEKTLLITQAKEAETLRNKEMKKFAGDKEYYAKQLTEAEKQVAEKDHDLQKWRVERDQLVAALEVQLGSLISRNEQKDKEMEELKKMIPQSSGKEHKIIAEGLRDDDSKELTEIGYKNVASAMLTAEKTQGEESSDSTQMQLKDKETNLSNGSLSQKSIKVSSEDNIQDQPDAVLDSYEVSSESEQISRFPKSEMEIQFSSLKPNKMEIKHQGSPSTVTLKVPRTRKRKSCTMDENENEKNVKLPANMNVWSDSLRRQGKKTALPNVALKNNYSLRNKHASNMQSTASPGGTLYKFGNLLQNSPAIIQTKAKKLMATMKSPKSTDEETVKKNDDKPKKAKRKLHSTNISAPIEFSGPIVFEDQKETDHEIIKRRLRMKKK